MKLKKSLEIVHSLPDGKTIEEYPYALSAEVFHTKQLFLYSEKVLPKRKASAPHFHRSIDEIVYVTRGELVAVEGDKEHVLLVGDSVCFASNSQRMHYLENRTENEAEFLIFRRSTKNNDIVMENS